MTDPKLKKASIVLAIIIFRPALVATDPHEESDLLREISSARSFQESRLPQFDYLE
jgi:hypothetical protein